MQLEKNVAVDLYGFPLVIHTCIVHKWQQHKYRLRANVAITNPKGLLMAAICKPANNISTNHVTTNFFEADLAVLNILNM